MLAIIAKAVDYCGVIAVLLSLVVTLTDVYKEQWLTASDNLIALSICQLFIYFS